MGEPPRLPGVTIESPAASAPPSRPLERERGCVAADNGEGEGEYLDVRPDVGCDFETELLILGVWLHDVKTPRRAVQNYRPGLGVHGWNHPNRVLATRQQLPLDLNIAIHLERRRPVCSWCPRCSHRISLPKSVRPQTEGR